MSNVNNSRNWNWWIPKSKVHNYLFRDKISETADFLSNHYLNDKSNQKRKDKFTHTFNSNDEAYSLIITDGFIDSVICHTEFIIQTNVIGESLAEAHIQINNRFGIERPLFTHNNEILSESGITQKNLYSSFFGIIITIDFNRTIISVQAFSRDPKKKRKYRHRRVSALSKVTPKATASYALISIIVILFIQLGRYTMTAERRLEERNPARYGNVDIPKLALTEPISEADILSSKRIVSSIYIDTPYQMTLDEVNALRNKSKKDRTHLLSYYRAFLDPNAPNLKTLDIERISGQLQIETPQQFDDWVTSEFPE